VRQQHRPGSVYCIDHYVVPTNDILTWQSFMENVLGGRLHKMGGLSTAERLRRGPIRIMMNVSDRHQIGGFLQNDMLPEPSTRGGAPRFGYFIRSEDVGDHLRRLEQFDIPHSDPIKTSEEGQEGTAIHFEDPDGNQLEFWAPTHLPAGALSTTNPTGVGRISHAVQESRDLNKTVEFYSRYCGLDLIESADIPKDTVAMEMTGGGRLVFKEVDTLAPRTGGHNKFLGQHTALTVENDGYLDAYQRLWDELPESEYTPYSKDEIDIDETVLAPRTELHGLEARGERGKHVVRGHFFYDWDCNNYHLTGGVPSDGAMAEYTVGHSD